MNSLEVIDTWIEPTPLWGVLMCAFATSSWSPGLLSRFFASLLSPLWQRDFRYELLVPILGKPLISARRPIRLDLSLSSSYSRSCAKNRGKPLTKLSPYNMKCCKYIVVADKLRRECVKRKGRNGM